MSEQVYSLSSSTTTTCSSSGTVVTGFDFDNVLRNQFLATCPGSDKLPKFKKTGTTIAGVIFQDGVVLGADTRATNDSEVAEKNCEKIHYLAPSIMCCGAGTAADTEMITQTMASQLELLRMNTHSNSRVVTACTLLKRQLFKYQGHISAALILGGCDIHGPALYQIHPHGSTSKLNYTTMGSGSLAAMAVFESSWTENLNEADAIDLVQRAIAAGIWNDLGSGSNIDICVLRTDGTKDYKRNYVKPNEVSTLRNQVHHSAVLTMHPGLTPTIGVPITTLHPAKVSLADVDVVVRMEVE